MAVVSRILRASMIEVMRHTFIITARAKGLKEADVITKHALKNAMIPTVTVIGLQVGALLGGVFLIEIIFDWPGMGLYAIRSIMELDYFAIMGVTVVVSIIYVLVNFVVDMIYAILDPRISLVEER
jgi:peptide/nickel transport system permease protein